MPNNSNVFAACCSQKNWDYDAKKSKPKLVSRSYYLSNPIVFRFVNHLTDLLDGKSISHEILIRDRRLPPSDERRTNPRFAIRSMEEAFHGYWWNRAGYDGNTKTLNEIQSAVKNSINMERLPEANHSSLEVLKQVLNYVTPEQRHTGQSHMVLQARRALYERAKAAHPERWRRKIRSWSEPDHVWLSPPQKGAKAA